jgi:hypothetical protein
MSGEFTITLTRDEYIAAFWLYLRQRWLWKRLVLTTLAVAALYFVLIVGLESWEWGFEPAQLPSHMLTTLVYTSIVVAALLAISRFSVPYRVGRLFDQLGIAGRATRFDFDAVGLRSANREATTNYDWNRFRFRNEDDRFVLLFLAEAAFIVIPKQQVAPEVLGRLDQTLAAANVPLR